MERGLVVVDDTDRHRELLREAGELAAGVGADLVLLSLMTESEFQDDYETIDRIAEAETMSYSGEDVLGSVHAFVSDVAEEALDGLDVRYETAVSVIDEDERADSILATARRESCDHVFIVGRKRSPTGKAIFGDVAQAVILNFEGTVTVRAA